jgi:hypothetical protein
VEHQPEERRVVDGEQDGGEIATLAWVGLSAAVFVSAAGKALLWRSEEQSFGFCFACAARTTGPRARPPLSSRNLNASTRFQSDVLTQFVQASPLFVPSNVGW